MPGIVTLGCNSVGPPLCHPERSGGICGSLNQHLIRIEAPPSPFVIPNAVEGSAVGNAGGQLRRNKPFHVPWVGNAGG